MGLFDNLSQKITDASAKRKEAKAEKKKQREQEDQEYEQLLNTFLANKATQYSNIYFDLKSNQILIGRRLLSREYRLLSFSDIQTYDISQQDHNETETKSTSKKKHTITRFVAGGLIAGPVGAVIGGVTGKTKGHSNSVTKEYLDYLGLSIMLKDGSTFAIPFLTQTTKSDSYTAQNAYNELYDIMAIIKAGMNATKQQEENIADSSSSNTSSLDEIKKLKELLDMNAITQEEFEAKKKELLNL